jgi:NAD(P)H dehydrogenase (quinone)
MSGDGKMIGITGASGQLGKRVVELVSERVSPSRVVAITRSQEKLNELAASGVVARSGDFAQPERLPAALEGIDTLFMISIDTLGDRERLHGNAIDAAKKAGVKHIVYSSAIKPQYSPIGFLRDHAATERLAVESGLAYTFLRNSFYLETVVQSAATAIAAGAFYSSASGGAAGYVSREDCARAAAAVLTTNRHEGAIYDITGSRAWSREEIAEEVSNLVGCPINCIELSDEELAQGLAANGLPPFVVDLVVGIDRGVRLGALDVVSRSVERLTGTPPEELPAFLARHRQVLMAAAG